MKFKQRKCEYCKKKNATKCYRKVWIMQRMALDGLSFKPEIWTRYDIEQPIAKERKYLCDECGIAFEWGKIK